MAEKRSPEEIVVNGSGSDAEAKALESETNRNIKKIADIEDAQKSKRTLGERMSVLIAAFCGSMTFVWVHVFWFTGWVLLNSVFSFTFDPFPYTFLTLVVSLEAIFLSTFILISQNHETRLTERRNHLDLQINLLTEQENTKILDLLQRIAVKVGIPDEDAATKVLLQPVDPEKLVQQIIDVTGDNPSDVKPKKN
jgi:uncharacterized membrane protein